MERAYEKAVRDPSRIRPEYGSIEAERGQRWSPLALGLLSVVCDPLFITSIVAIVRGVSELREVSQREADGWLGAEHARVRTGAVWGIGIASIRILALVLLGFWASVFAPLSQHREPLLAAPMYETFGREELLEIADRLHSENDEVRAQAARHLLECDLPDDHMDTMISLALRDDYPPPRGPAPHIPSVILRALAQRSDYAPPPAERIRTLYPSLDPAGKSAALELLQRRVSRDHAMPAETHAIFWSLVENDRSAPHPALRLPQPGLDLLLSEGWFERFLALPPSSPFAPSVLGFIQRRCAGNYNVPECRRALAYARRRWSALRDELASPPAPGYDAWLARQQSVQEAIDAITVLSEVDRNYLPPRGALESGESRVVFAAARSLWETDRPAPDGVLRRLLGDPLALQPVYQLFRENPENERLWIRDDLVASHVAIRLLDEHFAVTAITRRDHRPARRDDFVFEVHGFDGRGERALTAIVETGLFYTDGGAGPNGVRRDWAHTAFLEGPYDAARVEAVLENWSFHDWSDPS